MAVGITVGIGIIELTGAATQNIASVAGTATTGPHAGIHSRTNKDVHETTATRPLERAGDDHRLGRGHSFPQWHMADATTAHGRLMLHLRGLWARYLEAAEPQFLIFAYRLLTKMSYGSQTLRDINIIL